jgi:flagellar motility protein MotE (MotC chaperone)
MIDKARLIPAVILGAIGLLALKVISWSGEGWGSATPPAQPPAQVATAPYDPEQYKGFTKIIAKSRMPYVYPDPETTGSVPEKDKDKAKDKSKPDAKVDKKPVTDAEKAEMAEAKKQLENGPRNAANWLNGAERPLSPSEKALLERLGERRDEMDARLKEIELREKLLESVEKKIEGRAGDLKQLEDKANEGASQKDKTEAQGLKNLVIMYEAMKPKDAARIFDRLSLDVLVPVVQQINPRKMSEVLSSMSPEAAEKLTVALANRARNAGNPPAMTAAQAAPAAAGGELQAIAPAPKR